MAKCNFCDANVLPDHPDYVDDCDFCGIARPPLLETMWLAQDSARPATNSLGHLFGKRERPLFVTDRARTTQEMLPMRWPNLHVPDVEYPRFFAEVVECMPDVFTGAAPPRFSVPMALDEKLPRDAQAFVPFVMDLDAKDLPAHLLATNVWAHARGRLLLRPARVLLQTIVRVLVDVMRAHPEDIERLTYTVFDFSRLSQDAATCKLSYHLYIPMLLVRRDQLGPIVNMVRARLEDEPFCGPYSLGGIIDTGIYKSGGGLRLPFAPKQDGPEWLFGKVAVHGALLSGGFGTPDHVAQEHLKIEHFSLRMFNACRGLGPYHSAWVDAHLLVLSGRNMVTHMHRPKVTPTRTTLAPAKIVEALEAAYPRTRWKHKGKDMFVTTKTHFCPLLGDDHRHPGKVFASVSGSSAFIRCVVGKCAGKYKRVPLTQ